jgi:hypothetical protein
VKPNSAGTSEASSAIMQIFCSALPLAVIPWGLLATASFFFGFLSAASFFSFLSFSMH